MGGSGGGSAGMVQFPAHIASTQLMWIDSDSGYESPTSESARISIDLHDALNAAIGSSPFMGEVAFDSATRISNWETEIGVFETIVDGLSETTGWAGILAQAVTTLDIAGNWDPYILGAAVDVAAAWLDPSHTSYTNIKGNWLDPAPAAAAEITADVDAYEAIVDDHVDSDVLPRFQRGMQDVNAVMTSAFTIGQAIIEGMADRDVAKYQGDLRTKAYLLKDDIVAKSKLGESNRLADAYIESDKQDAASVRGESDALALAHMQDDRLNADNVKGRNLALLHSIEQMIQYVAIKMTSNEALARITLQSEAMALEAERVEAEDQREIDEADAKWDLTMFAYAGNFIAAGSGGTYVPPPRTGPSRTQATIGGAAAGAAMGAQVGGGNPYATGAGAVIGAYLSYSQY